MACRVFVNHMLSGVQQRNLERAWGRPVVDRVGLIIGIFAQRARTKEAQLQVILPLTAHETAYKCRLLGGKPGKSMKGCMRLSLRCKLLQPKSSDVHTGR